MTPDPVRLLIADDHPLYRSSVERLVRLEPRFVLAGLAADGREALTMILDLVPDIAIVDLDMPQLTGMELLDRLAQAGSPTKVVVLTGQLESEQVYRAVELGAVSILSKLVEPDTLLATLVEVAAGKTVLGAEVQSLLAGEVRSRRRDDRPILTEREREALTLIADGASVAEIAQALGLSPSTVKSHLESLYRKLEVSDRAAAVATAMRRGLLT